MNAVYQSCLPCKKPTPHKLLPMLKLECLFCKKVTRYQEGDLVKKPVNMKVNYSKINQEPSIDTVPTTRKKKVTPIPEPVNLFKGKI